MSDGCVLLSGSRVGQGSNCLIITSDIYMCDLTPSSVSKFRLLKATEECQRSGTFEYIA